MEYNLEYKGVPFAPKRFTLGVLNKCMPVLDAESNIRRDVFKGVDLSIIKDYYGKRLEKSSVIQYLESLESRTDAQEKQLEGLRRTLAELDAKADADDELKNALDLTNILDDRVKMQMAADSESMKVLYEHYLDGDTTQLFLDADEPEIFEFNMLLLVCFFLDTTKLRSKSANFKVSISTPSKEPERQGSTE